MIPKYKAYIIKENRIVDVETLHWNKGYGGALEIHVHNPNWSFMDIIDGKPFDPNNTPFFTYINHTDKVWLERQPHEFVLLQCTDNLRDKNGVVYCDGDEVLYGENLYNLCFNEYRFELQDFWLSYQDDPSDFFSEKAYINGEIIGNIHIKQ